MNTVIQDLRFALRTFAQRPGFTLVVVLTLGLGLGGAIAVFDLLNVLNWRRLPVEKPEEVVEVYTGSVHDWFGKYGLTSFPDYREYRDMDVFSGLAAGLVTDKGTEMEAGEVREEVNGWMVTGNYFEVLGVGAALGRVLGPDDDHAGAAPVVVLSWSRWQRSFGGNPGVLGQTVRIKGRAATIVGVAREGFEGTVPGSIWGSAFWMTAAQIPRLYDPEVDWLGDSTLQSFDVMGRLAPGVSSEVARVALHVQAERLDREHPIPDFQRQITVTPARIFFPGDWEDYYGSPTRLMAVAVALLLVIACANVANLLLARATARRREMALRRALGANRGRLIRQLLTESTLLALMGGLWGLCLASWWRHLLVAAVGEVGIGEMRFDARVLGLGFLACGASTLLFGLAPAFFSARTDLVTALKAGGSGDGGTRRLPLGQLMVGAQIALSAILLVTVGLLGRSLWNLRSVDPGFDGHNLVFAWTEPDPERYSHQEGRLFFRQLRDQTAALPGIHRAGLSMAEALTLQKVSVNLHLPEQPDEARPIPFNIVDGDYFETLGIPLVTGRLFTSGDGASSRPVAVVSQALAEDLWPGEDAVGRILLVEGRRPWDPGPEYEVIGVVGSTRQFDLRGAGDPIVYFSCYQRYRTSLAVAMRATADPGDAVTGLRAELARLDPALRLFRVRTFDEMRRYMLSAERLRIQAVGVFGLLGWFLAAVGVAAVMSYAASREVRDVGIRMALGARGYDVVTWMLGRGLKLTLGGLAVGLAAAFVAVPFLRHLLFGVGAFDLTVFTAVAISLVCSALVAVWLPARRAARIDPLQALRQE